MKLTIKTILVCMLFAVVVSACKKDDFPSGTTGDYYDPASIEGTWSLLSVTQIDEIAKSAGFPAEAQSLDLKTAYNFDGLKAEFKALGSDSTADFTITNPSNAPIFMPAAGKWGLKTYSGPVQLKLAGTDTTYYADIKPAYRASDNKLTLYISRKDVTGTPLVSYIYTFTR